MARSHTTKINDPSRSGKSKSTSVTTSKSKNSVSKLGKQTSKRATTTSKTKTSHKPSRIPSSSNSEDSEEVVEDDDSEDSQADTAEHPQEQSPEPDFILAELTHNDNIINSEPAISLPLIHRIMQEYWQDKEKTKITSDAREVVGKYVEVYVREAIMRCSFERKERDGIGRGGGTNPGNDGWLEVEDLERIAPQLCLDF